MSPNPWPEPGDEFEDHGSLDPLGDRGRHPDDDPDDPDDGGTDDP